MFHSRLPIELCELIIDRVRDPQALPWWARLQLVFQIRWHAESPTDLERANLHTLRACALTCSSWLPRARANLFHTVVFEDQEDVDRFVCSIAENRRLADLVRELVVDFTGGYVPFAQGTLVRNLRRVRTVVFPLLGVSTWHYPPRHQLLVAQFPLTELVFDLNASDYRMVVYAFGVVWSAHALERLTIMFSGHPPAFTEAQVRRIGVLRRRWSCGQLMTLAASGPYLQQVMDILPPRPFGTAVERVAIYLDNPVSARLVEQMRGFTSLRELRVGAPGMTQEWRPILEELVRILEALYNPNALRVAAVVVKNSNARSTRREFLSSLSILEEARVLKALTGLRAIRFEVTETARGENDEVWWQQKLEEHMPRMRRVVSIVAQVTGIDTTITWEEEFGKPELMEDTEQHGRIVANALLSN